MIDLVIIAAVALGAFAGWRRGFIMPLIAVGTGLVGLYALYAGPGASVVPSGTAGIGAGVLVVGVAANPQFGVMLDPGTLDTMATQVAKSAIPADQIATIDSGLAYYETDVRPQLLTSTLAPLILTIGQRVPVLGHAVTYPTK